MLGIADVKPVAEQDTDQSNASKIVPMTQSELDFKQAMASSNIAPYHQDEGQPIPNLSESENVGDDTEDSVIVPERFAFIFKNETERAAMARPSVQSPQSITDKSVVVMDCGASQTITESLLNSRDVIEKQTRIVTADGKEGMVSTHVCTKTYFVRNRTGEVVTLTVPSLFVRGLPQDLLGGKSVNRQNIRVILDANPAICGLYPHDKDQEQHYQNSIEFISEPTDLFYLQTETMDWTTFENLTGMTCGIDVWDILRIRISRIPLAILWDWRGWSERNSRMMRNVHHA